MIAYRLAAPAEYRLLAGIENDAQRAYDEAGVRHGFTPVSADFYAKELPHAHVVVAEEGGALLGFAAMVEADGQAHLYELSVAHAHQKRGIGRALLNEALELAVSHGYRAMTLTTCRDVKFNRPFYESCGFQVFDPDRSQPRLCGVMKKERARWKGIQERVAMIKILG